MSTQLILLDTPAPEWAIDPDTRQIGFRGIAAARAELAAARARIVNGEPAQVAQPAPASRRAA